MSILSWLFNNQQQKQQNNRNNNNINNHNQSNKINEGEEITFETDNVIIKTPLNIDDDESFEEEDDYNYFGASYFNNYKRVSLNNTTSTSTSNRIKENNELINHLNLNYNNNLPNELVISFDTTGKMFNYFKEFKLQIDQILKSLFSNFPQLKLSIIAHGDYYDDIISSKNNDKQSPSSSSSSPSTTSLSYLNKCISILPFTNDFKEIKSFVDLIEKTNGDDAPECYEYAMHKVRELPWSINSKKTLIIIGDDVPHPPSYTDQHFYWRNELHHLTKIGIKVYGIQCHNNRHAKLFYEELATLSNGRYCHLKNSKDIGDLILTISFRDFSNIKYSYFSDEILKNIIFKDNSDKDNNNNQEYFENKKKELENKFYQLFSTVFTRERDSSTNIRFPWWDNSFDVIPNPRYIWDDQLKLFIENQISIQNESTQIIPFNSPLAIETSTTPSSKSVQRCSPNSTISIFKKSPSINNNLSSSTFLSPFLIDLNNNSNNNNNNNSILHQENNVIKTISKPSYNSSFYFNNNNSFFNQYQNTPYNQNLFNNSSFSIAGMSIIPDKIDLFNTNISNNINIDQKYQYEKDEQLNDNNNNIKNKNELNMIEEDFEEDESEDDQEEEEEEEKEEEKEEKEQEKEEEKEKEKEKEENQEIRNENKNENIENIQNIEKEDQDKLLESYKKRKLDTFINQDNILNNNSVNNNNNNENNNNNLNILNTSSSNTSDNDDNNHYDEIINSNLISEFIKHQQQSSSSTSSSLSSSSISTTKSNNISSSPPSSPTNPPLKKLFTESIKSNNSQTVLLT